MERKRRAPRRRPSRRQKWRLTPETRAFAKRLGRSAFLGARWLLRRGYVLGRRFLGWLLDFPAWRQKRGRYERLAVLLTMVALALALDRASPPDDPDDLCSIFQEKRSWYKAAKHARERWGVPEPVLMAVLHQESSFRAHARPPRRKILWIIPWLRPTTAYGYGQVLDATWADYQRATGRPDAKRYDFGEVTYFVGWYGHHIHQVTGIAKEDAYGLYLAYHEGPAGYSRGSYLKKKWLLGVAHRVEERAARYENQYAGCRAKLDSWWWWWG